MIQVHYINEGIEKLCDGSLFKRLQGYSTREPGEMRDKRYKVFYMKSAPVDISQTGLKTLAQRIDEGLQTLATQIHLIRRMGFSVKLIKLQWFNVMDSCENMTGNRGFFALTYTFKKSKKKLK